MVDEATIIFVNNLFAWFLIIFWLFVWIGFLSSIVLARVWICSDNKQSLFMTAKAAATADPLLPASTFPGVSILKPLTGVDDTLSHNLESWFKLRYPIFEILFCVHDVDDPAVAVVNSLIDKYPGVDAKLVISGGAADLKASKPPLKAKMSGLPTPPVYKMPLSPKPSGDDLEMQKSSSHPAHQHAVADLSTVINPKIRNILPAYESCKYDLVFISDCNIEAEPETLHDVVSQMGPRVGTVCQMHFVRDPPSNSVSFGSIVNKVFFGTQNAKALLFLALLRVTTTVSAAMLVRKSALEECGGLRAFGCYLAEDFHIGIALAKNGWTHRLGSRLAWQNPAKTDISDVFNRLIRWKRLRQTTSPILVIVDPLSECILLGLVASWAITHVFPLAPFWGIFLAHCLAWFFADFLLLSAINRQPLKFPKFAFLLAWLVREVSAPVVHIISLLSRRVEWRGQQYYLHLGGHTDRLPMTPSQSTGSFVKQFIRRRASSLTLTPKYVPIVEHETKSCSESYSPSPSDCSLIETNSDMTAKSPSNMDIDNSGANGTHTPTGRRDKRGRHQQQASSPPSLSAINA